MADGPSVRCNLQNIKHKDADQPANTITQPRAAYVEMLWLDTRHVDLDTCNCILTSDVTREAQK